MKITLELDSQRDGEELLTKVRNMFTGIEERKIFLVIDNKKYLLIFGNKAEEKTFINSFNNICTKGYYTLLG